MVIRVDIGKITGKWDSANWNIYVIKIPMKAYLLNIIY